MQMKTIESFGADDLKKYIGNGYKLYLYGAGDAVSSYARIAVAALTFHEIDFELFFDDDDKKIGQIFMSKKIQSSSNIDLLAARSVILISSNYFKTILKGKVSTSNNTILTSLVRLLEETPAEAYSGLMSNEEAQRRLHTHKSKLQQLQGLKSSVYVNALDVQVTEKCTMKCKDCSNLMQYYEKPRDADTALLVRNLEKFLDAVDYLADARIIGGEPFIVKDLNKILDFLSKSEKVGHITVYTNGTIVPREDILDSLKSDKVIVEITDYNEHSKRLSALQETLQQRGVKYFSHRPQNWTDSARIVKNNLSADALSQMFDSCCVNDALTILHGRIYHCPFSANGINLNAYDVTDREFIEIESYDSSFNLREKFKTWYFGRPFLDSCSYCLGRDYMQPLVEPGVQIRKPIDIPIVRG